MEVEEKNVVQWLANTEKGLEGPPTGPFFRFHREYGHHTDSCKALVEEIERLIRSGHMKRPMSNSNNNMRNHSRGSSFRERGTPWNRGRANPGRGTERDGPTTFSPVVRCWT
ncbi:hypothetical protein BUALT_Bualt07G0086600 [Buddleja alternifolia]|uniref:Uncharacterized protein n=1 Tax=Buddleja alternifolia TaxID=168488 RepID=A0AAV6XAK4_9LAMI|nr:hypothetical protein BUALT_Bualt07G0086500 [Buddleja alternifolia]KAG8379420.1 hypothetical protein BUALT_Bualt07G0086600 [Buddleja alternifolia]